MNMETLKPLGRVATLKNVYEFSLALLFLYYRKEHMNSDREQNRSDRQQPDEKGQEQQKQHSSAFKETSRGDEKSTTNVEEEAGLEQERKEAMTERD
jgi:hypothetical protein